MQRAPKLANFVTALQTQAIGKLQSPCSGLALRQCKIQKPQHHQTSRKERTPVLRTAEESLEAAIANLCGSCL